MALAPIVVVGFGVAFVAVGLVIGAQAAVKFVGWLYSLRSPTEVAAQQANTGDG